MDMDMIPVDSTGAPWLDQPVALHSSRTPDYGPLTPEQLDYVMQYWLFWYEADHRYGLSTIAFFLAVVIVFTLAAMFSRFSLAFVRRSSLYRRSVAVCRYLAYKGYHLPSLHWYSPAAGVWLLGALGVVFFLAMMLGPHPYYWPNTATVTFGNSPPIATRSGWMSIACLPFVLMLGAKSNPISLLTRMPHEQLMVFHRWVAWAMFVLALVHTFPFIVYHTWKGDLVNEWNTGVFYWTGTVALLAQGWLQFMSISFIRNKYYETFKVLHLVMAALFFTFLFIHCDFILTSWDYLITAAVIYTVCLLASQLRTYLEHGITTFATLSPTSSGAIRVSIPTTSSWWPGQHIFVRFLTLDLHALTSHPFTICSLPVTDPNRDSLHMILYIAPRSGLTARLSSLAHQSPGGKKIRVLLDGPYGGMSSRSLHSFDHALVIAGGAGAGFTLPVVGDFLRREYSGGNSRAANEGEKVGSERKLRIILAVKTEAYRVWYEEVLEEVLRSCGIDPGVGGEGVVVDIHVTESTTTTSGAAEKLESTPSSSSDSEKSDSITSDPKGASGTVNVYRGKRPDLPALIKQLRASKEKEESLGIAACGPSSMLFDVRSAAAEAQVDVLKRGGGEVWLYREHFGW